MPSFLTEYTLENKKGVFAADIGYDVLKAFVRPPFQPGNTVYFKATLCSNIRECAYRDVVFVGLNYYYDIENNKTIYPNEGMESAQFSMVITE